MEKLIGTRRRKEMCLGGKKNQPRPWDVKQNSVPGLEFYNFSSNLWVAQGFRQI